MKKSGFALPFLSKMTVIKRGSEVYGDTLVLIAEYELLGIIVKSSEIAHELLMYERYEYW
jgi:hypothetical protein